MRVLHQKIGALISAFLVVFSGGIGDREGTMSSKKQSHDTPRVYTSKAGRRYARTSEVLCSPSARAEIGRYVKISKARKAENKTTAGSSLDKKS